MLLELLWLDYEDTSKLATLVHPQLTVDLSNLLSCVLGRRSVNHRTIFLLKQLEPQYFEFILKTITYQLPEWEDGDGGSETKPSDIIAVSKLVQISQIC